MSATVSEYRYHDAAPTWANRYLWHHLRQLAQSIRARGASKAFDLGCGNGATVGMLAEMGFSVIGVDPSASGIALAQAAHPSCRFEIGSAYDDLAARFGRFPLVISLEVVEHLYDPKTFAHAVHDLLEAGGIAIISTPYHGYVKNVALALSGKLDAHFTALWDGGHIKFFSIATLRQLLSDAGFHDIRFIRVGRLPFLAKSMIAIARRS
jgi:2-polyprenyl-6-hydroxyphenyl methylase/3-demethylubiquinone-9 3-methyltransferase